MNKKTIAQIIPVFLLLIFLIIVFLFSGCTPPPDEHEEETPPAEQIPETQILALSAISGDGELCIGWTAKDGVEYEVWYGTDNKTENSAKWNGIITVSLPVAGTVINGLNNSTQYYIWIKKKNENDFEGGISETPQAPPSLIYENFAYVSGGTVTGSHSYSIQVTVPADSTYMNAGKTLVKQGVFTEGRKIKIEPFFMAKHETTRQLWHDVQVWAEANGYSFQNKINAPNESNKNKPISNINWRDAIVWCNAYSEMA